MAEPVLYFAETYLHGPGFRHPAAGAGAILRDAPERLPGSEQDIPGAGRPVPVPLPDLKLLLQPLRERHV